MQSRKFILGMESLQEMLDNMNPSILFDIERGHPQTFKKFKEFKYNFLYRVNENKY